MFSEKRVSNLWDMIKYLCSEPGLLIMNFSLYVAFPPALSFVVVRKDSPTCIPPSL